MMRRSLLRSDFSYFGKTKFGQEALKKTKADMQTIDRSPNPLLRYMSKKRNIDRLQIEGEGRIADDLHPSFQYAMKFFTTLLCAPVLAGLLSGSLQPSYYLLVPTKAIPEDRYNRMWTLANPWIVASGQLFVFFVFYDLSIYVRMPFFAYVLAPLFRRFGPQRHVAKGTVSVSELTKRTGSKGWQKKRPEPTWRAAGSSPKQ